jgi:hypothetical protein
MAARTRISTPCSSAAAELRAREAGHRMFRTPERDVHVWSDADGET